MARNQGSYTGCLLGLAVGDAMGYTVDSRTLAQIREDYGPQGLRGYDEANSIVEVTSYTQLAAFTCNGLLLGLTSGQMSGRMSPLVKYASLAGREWAASQRAWGRPERTFCWLLHRPELCRRNCTDTRVLEILSKGSQATMAEPVNAFATPAALTMAAAVGLFCGERAMPQEEIDLLGAEVVALSHGNPGAFLSGTAVAHIFSRSIRSPKTSLKELALETAQMIKERYGPHYSQAFELSTQLHMAVSFAEDARRAPAEVLEQLRCETSSQVVAGAVYCALMAGKDFDRGIIAAVNHSGRSCAVGALTGGLLGLRLGETALPDFYVECLEVAAPLRELAEDLFFGCPMEQGNRLFDLDWDRKYIHGGR